MTDWLWNDLADLDRSRLADILQTEIRTKGDFVVAAIGVCKELRMCQVIATASKHVNVKDRPDPTLETAGYMDFNPAAERFAKWTIKQGQVEYPAEEVFERVRTFWRLVLSRLQMIEDETIFFEERSADLSIF